jgi:hypothetical protein
MARFDMADVLQTLAKCARSVRQRVRRCTDHRHRALLRVRRERPCRRRAAEQHNELAPLHVSNPRHRSGETIAPWTGFVGLTANVRVGPLADIRPCPLHVRFRRISGHCSAPLACPLRAATGVMHRSKIPSLYYLRRARAASAVHRVSALGHFVRRTIMAFCRTQELKGR